MYVYVYIYIIYKSISLSLSLSLYNMCIHIYIYIYTHTYISTSGAIRGKNDSTPDCDHLFDATPYPPQTNSQRARLLGALSALALKRVACEQAPRDARLL